MMIKNVGLMVPANNTTMEREFPLWSHTPVKCQLAHIPRGTGLLTPETLPAYGEQALRLAAGFSDIDILVYGCTAAGFMSGPEAEESLAERLAGITGVPVVTTARAMAVALAHAGARKIDVLTPYQPQVNEQLADFLAYYGVAINKLDRFEVQDTAALGAITADQVREKALPLLREKGEALFIACSQLPTYPIFGELINAAQGKPVWTSIQASAWQSDRILTGQ